MQGKDQLLEVDTTAFGNANPFSGSGEGAQDGPPPPYESVIMHDGGRGDGMVRYLLCHDGMWTLGKID